MKVREINLLNWRVPTIRSTSDELTTRCGWRIEFGMNQLLDDDRMRWAEALTIMRIHDRNAARWIAERVGALAIAGDEAGVQRFKEIARRCDQLLHVRCPQ